MADQNSGSNSDKSQKPLKWAAIPLVTKGLVPAPEWFVEEMLPEDCLGVLYGQPGCFKTFEFIALVM